MEKSFSTYLCESKLKFSDEIYRPKCQIVQISFFKKIEHADAIRKQKKLHLMMFFFFTVKFFIDKVYKEES